MKKILSVLLAICIMVGMVTVLASADAAKQALIKMPFADTTVAPGAKLTDIIINEGDPDKHYLTVNGVLTAEGASATNYNVKLSYATGGTPTLSLKGAEIIVPDNMRDSGSNNSNVAIAIGRYDKDFPDSNICDYDFIINVESDSSIKNTWDKVGTSASDTYHGANAIVATIKGDLTFTGAGKLDLWADNASLISKELEGDIIFKDFNMKAELAIRFLWSQYLTIDNMGVGDVIFDNTKAELLNNYNGCVKATDGKIIIKNGSNVSAITTSNGCWNHNILDARSEANGGIVIDNANVLANGVGESQLAVGTVPVEFTGVNAKGGTKEANAKAYSNKKQSGYYYLIAGPDVVIETDPPATEPPATTKPAAKPTTATQPAGSNAATKPAGSNAATKPAGTVADGNNATTGNDATTPVDNNTTGEKKGGLTWLYILLGVVILAGAAVLVLVIVKRNAAAAELEEETEEVEGEETEEIEGEETEEAEEAAEETAEEPETTEDAE